MIPALSTWPGPLRPFHVKAFEVGKENTLLNTHEPVLRSAMVPLRTSNVRGRARLAAFVGGRLAAL
eukprot:4494259-Amphidinium_carterae.3